MRPKKLTKVMRDAEKADGYLIMVTLLKGETLTHTYFTKNFRKNDIMASLDEQAKLLEPEAK